MPSKDKRKLAAIMFADIVGYSRMMARNEERTLELLKDFENICSPIISDNGGEIIKKVGDELFCEFSSAKQAVDCALSIQKTIQPYNDSRPKDFILQVRIGIHLGDIVLRDGDVFGDGVNVASRIQPLANPGGISISGAVNDTISNHSGYEIRSKGEQELKNILKKHSIYEVITGNETFSKKINTNKILLNKNFLYIIGIISIFVFSILYYLLIGNNEKRLEISNIILPSLSSRLELIPLLDEFKIDYKHSSLNNEELNNIYSELIKIIKTNFYPNYNIYDNIHIEKSFEKIGEIYPDFNSNYSFLEGIVENKLDETYYGIMFDEEGELQENNQIVKTINIVDNNELSSDLFISFYIYHRKDSSNNHSYYIEAEFIEFIQYSSGDLPVSNAWNKELSSTENLIPTLLGIIYEALNKSIDYELKIKSVEKEKILIQIDHDQILPRTEYNVQKSIDFKNIESIQNTIHEIKLFIECCKQKEDINEDINCLKLDEHPSTYGWNDNLIMELDSIINNYSTTLTDNKTYGIETSVLITEVYDSIAVGKIIDYNENACIKVLPGDILIPIK